MRFKNMIIEKTILLLKSQKDDNSTDKYEDLLIKNGFHVTHGKTLVFNFKNIDVLKDKLENCKNYEGIIFSSPRCVHATYLAVKEKIDVIKPWQTKHNFVVGEATFRVALEKLELECKGKETGNSVNLSQFILQYKNCYTSPFLFPHGNLKTDTLNKELAQHDVKMEGVLVYDTISNPDIEKELEELTDNFQNIAEFVVFFSPSGLISSIEFLRKIPTFDSAKLIAIGPVTELAMKERDLKIFGVTKNPTPDDLLNVILMEN